MGHGFQRQVTSGDSPLVVLLDQDGADQTHDGFVVGKDAHHVGASLDLLVDALQWIGRVDLRAMLRGEAHESEHVGFRLIHELCQFFEPHPQAVGDLAPLSARRLDVLLDAGGADRGGDHFPLPFGGVSECVAHEMHAGVVEKPGESRYEVVPS